MLLPAISLLNQKFLTYDGGFFVTVLFIVSLIALVLYVEKLFRLREARVYERRLQEQMLEAVRNRDTKQLETFKQRAPGPMNDMIHCAQESHRMGTENQRARMSSVASLHLRRLAENIPMLGTLANIAFVVGLLGTIVGSYRSFSAYYWSAPVDFMSVGQGLRQAVLTSVVGLSAGVAILLGQHLLKKRINRFAAALEQFRDETIRAFETAPERSNPNRSRPVEASRPIPVE